MLPVPVPRDIPLPLPADGFYLEPLLIVAFIAHILFVNLTVGGAVYVFLLQLWSRRRPDYAVLARAVAQTLTVNKSMAVVLGVAPLLLINVLYTVHFYTANALTGMAWIALVVNARRGPSGRALPRVRSSRGWTNNYKTFSDR